MSEAQGTGVLLVNLGTPDSPSIPDVRRYLREFLGDPKVLDMPALLRWLLLNFIILPFRPKHSAHAYQQIWTDKGSPLLVHSEHLAAGLKKALAPTPVALGMRYGSPSIANAVCELKKAGATNILHVPLFPQHSNATVGSAVEAAEQAVVAGEGLALSTLPPFFDEAWFVEAWVAVLKDKLAAFGPDHVLLSYHGLPTSQVKKYGGPHCAGEGYESPGSSCCDAMGSSNANCYRAQCLATSRALVQALGLDPVSTTTSFQSRTGRTPWIGPHTDEVIEALPGRGARRLAVVSPAFVADCLETLEELGMRGKESFLQAGGDEFLLLPSLNDHPEWIGGLARRVQQYMEEA